MTYSEALELQKQRQVAWDNYYEQCGSSAGDLEQCVQNSPEDIFNYNVISRCNGIMLAASDDKGVYEYPTGIMAWGYGIPEEAYVSEECLNEDTWNVISRKETYDW